MKFDHLPQKQGLYDPAFEHDSCGVGFVCNVKGEMAHDIVEKGLDVLEHMSHRGAVGADPETGDGAGILIQIPHDFYVNLCKDLGISLPAKGKYATGIVFLPTEKKEQEHIVKTFEKIVKEEGQDTLGWRDVPVDDSRIGVEAKRSQPRIKQIFIQGSKDLIDPMALERKIYVIRRRIEQEIQASDLSQKKSFYIPSLSSRTISYKGLLKPDQVRGYFKDLQEPTLKTALILVHSRYSTNTFPTWDLAQPFRFLAHNGEINTVRANINWMKARESLLESPLFGEDIEKIRNVIVPGGSDSATIDNVFEILELSGRSIPHVMMMLVPSAWEHNEGLNDDIKDFYKFHSCFMEPWDGPAAIAVTDGIRIGAVLDRNGLRPARYIITKDDLVVMASEVGVLDIEPENIQYSGRLEPGKIFFIDTEKGCIVQDEEVKKEVTIQKPYGKWLKKNVLRLQDLPKASKPKAIKEKEVVPLMKVFGYTREDLKEIIAPMADTGKESIGAMGNDTPHAILSEQPQVIYNYFKQLFAQVTNPAIDPIREVIVMSLRSYIGPQTNILGESPLQAHKLFVRHPILTDEDLEKIRAVDSKGFKTKTISILFDVKEGNAFRKTIEKICIEAEAAINDGYTFIILSDRAVDKDHAALPAVIAAGSVHHYLVEKTLRSRIGIILESAEPREVMHFAVLFGYGVDCIDPYLAYGAIEHLIREKRLRVDYDIAIRNFEKAINKGILKILSKMGISTLKSYRGSQMFEILGLGDEVVEKCFRGTTSRIGGASFETLEKEVIRHHEEAYPDNVNLATPYLSTGGVYQWKKDGEFHLWHPESIASLQEAARNNDHKKYKEFANSFNDQSNNPTTLRSLFNIKKGTSIPLEKVEPLETIVKRFATGAMSFGSISRGAHESIAIAMNKLGGKSNTGEGGEDPSRFTPKPDGSSARSAIKQIASGRFGVTTNYLTNADELQIKIAQGAKPGEGGQLPGHKVSAIIARTRYTTPGVTLISPPPHHDIYSIEDLAQLIFDLKNVNPRARISVKLVSEMGVGTIAAGVAKGHADMILISGGDGGTGASPRTSIRYAGLPWELGLSEAHQTLVLNDLRSRVRLQTDGQMRTGRDVAIAAMLGAEEYGFCTSALIVLGCVMLRHCNLNNCSVGVATQDPLLERRFQGRPEYVENYIRFVVEELREVMAEIGIARIEDLIGRTDLLGVDEKKVPEKAKGIDLSRILYKPEVEENVGIFKTKEQDHGIENVLDRELIQLARNAIDNKETVNIDLPIRNVNRTTGAMLSGEICFKHGEDALPTDTIKCKFHGVAGQSFGAFLSRGVTFELEGLANDYVGKGISGGKIIIYPNKDTDYRSEENIIIGNTAFYGAITGEAYIRGIAGERFCIRNSGFYAVVEGVGDHGCEYMTGGRVVVLGPTGRNFAAGMSGGIAYIYDVKGDFSNKCNMDMVEFDPIEEDDKSTIMNLLHNHSKYTGSSVASEIIEKFNIEISKFKKVMPVEYKRVLSARQQESDLDLLGASDG